jgi:hypothetical protein
MQAKIFCLPLAKIEVTAWFGNSRTHPNSFSNNTYNSRQGTPKSIKQLDNFTQEEGGTHPKSKKY